MNKIKKYFLPLFNIILALSLFVILLFTNLSENIMYIMIMTLFIGWLIPYIVLLITGISLLHLKKVKLTLIFNIMNILMCLMIIILIIYLYDNKLIIPLIEYIIIAITSIINTIYLIFYLKKHPVKNESKEESKKIKQIKKENNGAIV